VSDASSPGPLRARLTTMQGDPPIGGERITVHHGDGTAEEVLLHDYARLYALPGVYEQIVQEDLGCRSPAQVAGMLSDALAALGRRPADTRVIDIAAGNGVSGEALRAVGVQVVLGTDIVPEAREAALRDRPGVYDEYLTLDLTALEPEAAARIRAFGADALTCVAPVGTAPGTVPPQAIATACRMLTGQPLVITLHDARHGEPDPIDESFFAAEVGAEATRLDHERYLHRFLVTGAPYELEASVWKLRPAAVSGAGGCPRRDPRRST
jgi:hypothetical protein